MCFSFPLAPHSRLSSTTMVDSNQGTSSSFRLEDTPQNSSHSNGPALDDSPTMPPTASPQTPPEAQGVEQQTESNQSPVKSRANLIARARSFLASPQVRHQDLVAKRAFLVEKGLSDLEIEKLLFNIVRVCLSVVIPEANIILRHHQCPPFLQRRTHNLVRQICLSFC